MYAWTSEDKNRIDRPIFLALIGKGFFAPGAERL